MIEIFNLKLKINVGRGTILIEKKQSNNRMETSYVNNYKNYSY